MFPTSWPGTDMPSVSHPQPPTQALPKVLRPSHAPRRSSLETEQRSHHRLWPRRRTCTEPAKETGDSISQDSRQQWAWPGIHRAPHQPAWVRKTPAPLGCASPQSPHWQMGPRQEKQPVEHRSGIKVSPQSPVSLPLFLNKQPSLSNTQVGPRQARSKPQGLRRKAFKTITLRV